MIITITKLQLIFLEVIEDISLSHAITEGLESESVSRDEVFAILEGNGKLFFYRLIKEFLDACSGNDRSSTPELIPCPLLLPREGENGRRGHPPLFSREGDRGGELQPSIPRPLGRGSSFL